MKLSVLLPAILGAALWAGCANKGPSLEDPVPADPIEERLFYMARIGPVLEKATCTCCSKPLAQCYRETVEHRAKACPNTCANCLFEGRVALALKKQNVPEDEVARRTVAAAKGEEPAPAGVTMDMGAH